MKYKLPEHLEPYRDLIGNTGGLPVEELIGRLSEKRLAQTNFVVYVMAISAETQINLLERLYKKGLLK